MTPFGHVTADAPEIPDSVECREKGFPEGRVLWVFVFFFQASSSKSFETESVNLVLDLALIAGFSSFPSPPLPFPPLPFPSFPWASVSHLYNKQIGLLLAKVHFGSTF